MRRVRKSHTTAASTSVAKASRARGAWSSMSASDALVGLSWWCGVHRHGLECCCDRVERSLDTGTHRRHGTDDHDRDQRRNQTVLNGSDAIFFTTKVLDELNEFHDASSSLRNAVPGSKISL